MTDTRAEHLAWAKTRALAELDADPNGSGPANAISSITSDLAKHPDTRGHQGIELMQLEAMSGFLRTPDAVRHCIDGFQ